MVGEADNAFFVAVVRKLSLAVAGGILFIATRAQLHGIARPPESPLVHYVVFLVGKKLVLLWDFFLLVAS